MLSKTFYNEIKPLKDAKIIHETLSRIGIVNRANELFQTVHLIAAHGQWYAIHFKEAYSLDHFKETGEVLLDKILMSDEDFNRRNRIIQCLSEWKLAEIDPSTVATEGAAKFFIVPFQKKNEFSLVQKVKIKS